MLSDDSLVQSLADCRVGIIGLGLIGGSMALALRGHCASIAGYDGNEAVVEQALDGGVIDCPLDLSGSTQTVDLVIPAIPVRSIIALMPKLPAMLPGRFHVIDLGSTKSLIVKAMNALPDRIAPLGGHPMAGKEKSGLEAAESTLFRDRVFVFTPVSRTCPETLEIGQQLAAAIGSRPIILDPERHDQLAAVISHVPHLVSSSIVDAAEGTHDEMAWMMASSGFRDSTRLAAAELTRQLDVIMSNRAAILDDIERVVRSLQVMAELIELGDEAGLRAKLEIIRKRRAGMYQ